MDTDKSFQKAVIKEFGHAILDKQGNIDREKLGEIVFNNADKRRKLNKLSHPRIFRRIFTSLLRLKLKEKK